MSDVDRERYEAAAEFHGHFGPGLAIGYRICQEALTRFDLTWDEAGAINAVTETMSCPADSIQHLLGATFGKGRLLHLNTGKQALSFYNRDTGDSFRCIFTGRRPKELDRKGWEQHILTAPFEELFEVTTPARLEFPELPRFFPDETCADCGEGMSPLRALDREDGERICYECGLREGLIAHPW